MSPRPEQVGESCLLEREMVQDLADLIDVIVSSADRRRMGTTLSFRGLILEEQKNDNNREQLLHILIQGEGQASSELFALGGENFHKFFKAELTEKKDERGVSVYWEGETGVKAYPRVLTGLFDPNTENLCFCSRDKGYSEYLSNVVIIFADDSVSTREQLEGVGINTVSSVKKIRAALEQAGMSK